VTDNSKTYRQDRKQCAAKGCPKRAAGFSIYCHSHRHRHHYTRDPRGRILRKRLDLGPYTNTVNTYLPRWKDHPAITKACAWLESLLADGSTYNGSSRTHRAIAKELRRLQRDGATGEAMFRKLAAVAGYAHFNRRTWDDGPCHTVNLAHHMLRAVPRPGAGKITGPAVYAIGQEVRETLGPLLVQFWQSVERDTTKQQRAREAIAQALEGEPLA
jgi:hypothetical protein